MIISPSEAAVRLQQGDVVALPTETVYGLAGDATNPQAVARIYEIKRRPADNPLICHFASADDVLPYVVRIPDDTRVLMQAFTPGPISFMLNIPDHSPLLFATCGSRQVIVRIPAHPVFQQIARQIGVPLAAPSANTSGFLSPTSAAMVEADLGRYGVVVVDGGPCAVGVESTIVDARSSGLVRILRPGAIGAEEIRSILPRADIEIGSAVAAVPGSRYRHYAPATPLVAISADRLPQLQPGALLLHTEELLTTMRERMPPALLEQVRLFSLGSISNITELARNFYYNLQQVDRIGAPTAYVLVPDWGTTSLGKALNDRFNRMLAAAG